MMRFSHRTDEELVKQVNVGRSETKLCTVVLCCPEPLVEFTKPLEDQTVEEEATATLECEVSRENAEVQWFRDGQEIRKTKKYEMIIDSCKRALIIHDCCLDDSKTYTCDAKECIDSLILISLIVLDAKLLAGLTAKAGSKIELPAEVTGKPEPRVKWTKADLVLKPDDRVAIDTKPGHSIVTIAKTKRDDSSTYIIEATNSSGRATATVDVNILGKIRGQQNKVPTF
uniref:Ig-like domain-containing protein n=1 Tax=Stegastes partitus TaxID=144197 RepID=A0A3B5BGW3_9TELE